MPAQLRFIFSNLGNVLHGEAHSAHLVLAEADNGNLVAQSQDIFHAVDALFCDLGDVNHAFLAGCELNECAELLDADNLALEDLSSLELGGDDLDHLDGFIHHFLISTAYGNAAVICDIDLYTGAGNDLVNGLASLTNNITDLLRIDLDGNDLRCIFTNLCSRMCDAGSHDLVDDIFSCFFGSCNRLFYNRSCQAVDLDIHLNCGDTVMGTCYLEVHIAEEVFQTLDIGQDDIIIIGIAGNQTTGNTSNLLLDRNARCHQRQCRMRRQKPGR